MKKIHTLLAMTFLSFAAYAQNPTDFDIIGVKFGMNVDQVKAALKAHNPAFAISTPSVWKAIGNFPSSTARLVGSISASQNSPTGEVVNVSFDQVTQKSYYISRKVTYESKTDMMSISVLTNSVRSKYRLEKDNDFNKPMSDRSTYYWYYDPSGANQSAQRTPENMKAACGVQMGAAPTSSAKGCGISVLAQVDGSNVYAGVFQMAAVDHKILMNSIISMNPVVEAERQAENAKKEGKEQANKPKL